VSRVTVDAATSNLRQRRIASAQINNFAKLTLVRQDPDIISCQQYGVSVLLAG
jgi:hypothetical protein